MATKVKDLVGSDIWLNKLIKDPDKDTFQAERGERDKDLDGVKPGVVPKRPRRKRGKHV